MRVCLREAGVCNDSLNLNPDESFQTLYVETLRPHQLASRGRARACAAVSHSTYVIYDGMFPTGSKS